jgi:hypothetical protein
MATCLSPPAEPPSRRLTPSTSMSSGTTTSSGPKQCQPVGEAMVDRRPRGRRVMCKATRLDEPLGDHGGPQGQDRGAVGADRQGWVHSWRACSCGSRKPIGGRTVLAGGPTQPRSVVMLSRDGVLGSRGRKSAVGDCRSVFRRWNLQNRPFSPITFGPGGVRGPANDESNTKVHRWDRKQFWGWA